MRFYILFISFFLTLNIKAQEGVPVYFDYLTENYYLVHPSMAGVNLVGGKLRMTARKQWFDQVEAPNLQTLTADLRLSERSGVGVTVFNDQNGYHSQKGLYLTYAHHINFNDDIVYIYENVIYEGLQGNIETDNVVELDVLKSRVNTFNSPVKVKEVKDEVVVIDANHDLAGKDLIFDIELVSIN